MLGCYNLLQPDEASHCGRHHVIHIRNFNLKQIFYPGSNPHLSKNTKQWQQSWGLQLAESNEAYLNEENALYTYKVNQFQPLTSSLSLTETWWVESEAVSMLGTLWDDYPDSVVLPASALWLPYSGHHETGEAGYGTRSGQAHSRTRVVRKRLSCSLFSLAVFFKSWKKLISTHTSQPPNWLESQKSVDIAIKELNSEKYLVVPESIKLPLLWNLLLLQLKFCSENWSM